MRRILLLTTLIAVNNAIAQTAAVGAGAASGADSGQADKLKTSFTHFFRPVIGAGFNLRTDDYVDFKVSADGKNLLTENDSKFRVAGIAGFWIPWSTCGVKWERWLYEEQVEKTPGAKGESPAEPACYAGKGRATHWRMRSGLLATMQLNQGSSNSAFSLGYGFMIRPGVILQASYTRSLGKELSYGFRQAAANVTRSLPNDRSFDPWRNGIGNGELGSLKQWDGFPLKYGPEGTAVFPGSPIVDSYNGSFTFGVAIPLDRILRTSGN